MLEGAEAVGEAAGLLDDQVDGLGAAVGDPAAVSKRARTCWRQVRRVRPSRATSGIGQGGNESMTCSASRRPSAGVSAW